MMSDTESPNRAPMEPLPSGRSPGVAGFGARSAAMRPPTARGSSRSPAHRRQGSQITLPARKHALRRVLDPRRCPSPAPWSGPAGQVRLDLEDARGWHLSLSARPALLPDRSGGALPGGRPPPGRDLPGRPDRSPRDLERHRGGRRGRVRRSRDRLEEGGALFGKVQDAEGKPPAVDVRRRRGKRRELSFPI